MRKTLLSSCAQRSRAERNCPAGKVVITLRVMIVGKSLTRSVRSTFFTMLRPMAVLSAVAAVTKCGTVGKPGILAGVEGFLVATVESPQGNVARLSRNDVSLHEREASLQGPEISLQGNVGHQRRRKHRRRETSQPDKRLRFSCKETSFACKEMARDRRETRKPNKKRSIPAGIRRNHAGKCRNPAGKSRFPARKRLFPLATPSFHAGIMHRIAVT